MSLHKKAKVETWHKKIQDKIKKLKIDRFSYLEVEGRQLRLKIMEDRREEVSRLDGCYCIKTDLKKEQAEAQIIHDRYKDLAEKETCQENCVCLKNLALKSCLIS